MNSSLLCWFIIGRRRSRVVLEFEVAFRDCSSNQRSGVSRRIGAIFKVNFSSAVNLWKFPAWSMGAPCVKTTGEPPDAPPTQACRRQPPRSKTRFSRVITASSAGLRHPARRLHDQFSQRGQVDVIEALQVETALAGLALPQPLQQRAVSFEAGPDVESQFPPTWGKAGQEPLARPTAGVGVAISAESDDALSPHRRPARGC